MSNKDVGNWMSLNQKTKMKNGRKLKIRKGYKYNSEERKIARRIWELKNQQKRLHNFEKFQEKANEINLLMEKLNGKYGV